VFESVRRHDAKADDGDSVRWADVRPERLHAPAKTAEGSGSATGVDAD
jgi:hypothetical protein